VLFYNNNHQVECSVENYYSSSTQISCVTQAAPAGTYNIRVYIDGVSVEDRGGWYCGSCRFRVCMAAIFDYVCVCVTMTTLFLSTVLATHPMSTTPPPMVALATPLSSMADYGLLSSSRWMRRTLMEM
jgi:hypothetical protein